ncbi:MAG: MotA/TolQ/ExbB proton channel family protein [Thiogranum sp.]
MNQSTVLGFLGGLVFLVAMIFLSPVNATAFFNIPGLIVVIGGTLAATFVSRPIEDVYKVLRTLPELFREDEDNIETDITQLLRFASLYRGGKLRAAERELTAIGNPFLSCGLQQVIDGATLDDLNKSMHWRMSGLRSRDQGQTQILYSMSVFAPAFGMLGTLFGLVHMLSGLGNSGLNDIGVTMAFAMITTVYGIVASNLIFKPLAIKMERRTSQRLMRLNSLREGILQIYEKRHPTLIKDTLDAFYAHHQVQVPTHSHLELVKA